MTKLKELEQRLRTEPDNLGLRVVVAGALHEAGRRADAVELYRSVAIAYRDQGRQQQAVAVCRSILELAPEDARCQELLEALLSSAPAPRASPVPPSIAPGGGAGAAVAGSRSSPMPGSRPSPMPGPMSGPGPVPGPGSSSSALPASRPSPMPSAGSSSSGLPASERRPSPLPGAIERPSPLPLPRPSEPMVRAGEPVRRSSMEMTPLPAPLAHHDADPGQRLSPMGLPTIRQDIVPEITGIAAAARQISASLIAASRMAEQTTEQTQELDDDDLAAEVDTGRLLRPGAPRVPPSASVPPPFTRSPPPPTPPPPVRRPPTPSPAPSQASPPAAAPEPAPEPPWRASETGTATIDDEPTFAAPPEPPSLPPARTPAPRPIDDEKTQPRDLPTRMRPPSIAPATAASGPLAGAFFAPLPPRNRGAVLQRCRRRMIPAGASVIRRAEPSQGLVIVVRGRLELRADGAAVIAIEAGEFIGEAALLAGELAAADVVATADSELLVLAPDDFHDVVRAFPALRGELEAVAARRPRR